MSTPPSGETWQLVVHPAATDGLVSWLRSRDLDVTRIPSGDDLPTYTLTPTAAAIRDAKETHRG
ncbi:hypothetical protein B1813_18910 [Saccharomonospora piscinae]|uniref:Uncharacterized protein n=1 Tax=Saccharomonospora piscinae TaxID=687388 RepID=A0A1V8ZYG0_SACPI|nr:hypothetical protein [Saccharomonospora piscinae]OQO89912.1 hypothetical protein B1813_18910 [Saccharomonospora piscinae]